LKDEMCEMISWWVQFWCLYIP